MSRRQGGESDTDPNEKRIAGDNNRLSVALGESRECGLDTPFVAGVYHLNCKTKRTRSHLYIAHIGLGSGVVGINQEPEHSGVGDKLMQDADLLLQEVLGEERDPRNISPWTVEAGDEAEFDRIAANAEHDGNCRRRRFGRRCRRTTIPPITAT